LKLDNIEVSDEPKFAAIEISKKNDDKKTEETAAVVNVDVMETSRPNEEIVGIKKFVNDVPFYVNHDVPFYEPNSEGDELSNCVDWDSVCALPKGEETRETLRVIPTEVSIDIIVVEIDIWSEEERNRQKVLLDERKTSRRNEVKMLDQKYEAQTNLLLTMNKHLDKHKRFELFHLCRWNQTIDRREFIAEQECKNDKDYAEYYKNVNFMNKLEKFKKDVFPINYEAVSESETEDDTDEEYC
jgi:hypothetical protein